MALGSIFGQRTDLSNVSGILGPENGGTGGNSLTQFGTLLYEGNLTNNVPVDIDGSCSLYYGIVSLDITTYNVQPSTTYDRRAEIRINGFPISSSTSASGKNWGYSAQGILMLSINSTKQKMSYISIYSYDNTTQDRDSNVVGATIVDIQSTDLGKVVYQNGGVFSDLRTYSPFSVISAYVSIYGVHSFT